MMELEALQAVWPELRALGASLVAISPQLPQYGRAVRRRAKLEFDVLTDLHLRVAEAFRLVFTLPAELKELYASFGHALDKFHDEPAFRLPMPAHYVMDQSGLIRAADVNPDYTVRPEPDGTVAIVRDIQAGRGSAERAMRREAHE
jgi:peroxiredoxin